jgi:predicted metalloprotease
MRWEGGRRSGNVEDLRGRRVSRGLVGGGIGTIILVVGALLLGADPSAVLELLGGAGQTVVEEGPSAPRPAEENRQADFVSVVLADTEDVWGAIFQANGRAYRPPALVLFTDAIDSACGMAGAATGPFYCPSDAKVYLDLSFFRELSERFGAPGDFAHAYVVAHEVGHHVQHELGIAGKVAEAKARSSEREANDLSVRLELQADCLAGVWGNHAGQSRDLLEIGDLEEALSAASAIGDDRIQEQSRGYAVPDSFTHGTSAQRQRWFRRGFAGGDIGQCDTFDADSL